MRLQIGLILVALVGGCMVYENNRSDAPQTSSEAMCTDLRGGASVNNIMGSRIEYQGMSMADVAKQMYGNALSDCPDQLRSNAGFRGFLQGQNINPDAR